MATNNLKTDYWIETADPISNLKTEQYNFALTAHPSFSLKTDMWVPYFYNFNPGNTWLQTILFVGATTNGDVQTINIGKDDDGTPLYYELETHEIEFGNRSHLKTISDQIQVLSNFGIDSALQIKEEDGNYKNIQVDLTRRVNINDSINVKGKYFTFKWFGEANETSPILEGISIERITDLGLTNE